MFDLNKDGRVDWRDVAMTATLMTTLFNAFLNILTVFGLGVSLTSNSVPVLECRPIAVAGGRTSIKCYRPESVVVPPESTGIPPEVTP